jgi:protein-S-isoprenylcysteine O-methyltransferase Ste14
MNLNLDEPINAHEDVIVSVAGLLFLLQLISLFYYDNFDPNIIVLGIGWILLIPGFSLLSLSITALRTYGNVPEGRSWLDTTTIVMKGIYRIVRHPLYIGWIIMSASLALILQSWSSTLCAIIIIPLAIVSISLEESSNIMKFGYAFLQYQKEVPLVNIFTGFWRYYRRKRTS